MHCLIVLSEASAAGNLHPSCCPGAYSSVPLGCESSCSDCAEGLHGANLPAGAGEGGQGEVPWHL